ncbi:MAG: FkbM family methyltransferase [Pseudomonadota bacterium]
MRPPPRWLRRAPLVKEPIRRLSKRFAPSGPLDVVVEGTRFAIDPSDNKVDFDIWYKRRLEEAHERAFLAAHLKEGDWFVDVGANIGLYTVSLLLAVTGLKTVSFEPLDRLRARLETNLTLNGLTARAVVRSEAVGPSGNAQLYESGNAGRSSLIAFEGARLGRTVAVRPLHEMLNHLGVVPAAVKIDVEGFEAEALMPYFDEAPPTQWPQAIVIETLHRAHWRRDCLQELFQRGYVEDGSTLENALLVRRSV